MTRYERNGRCRERPPDRLRATLHLTVAGRQRLPKPVEDVPAAFDLLEDFEANPEVPLEPVNLSERSRDAGQRFSVPGQPGSVHNVAFDEPGHHRAATGVYVQYVRPYTGGGRYLRVAFLGGPIYVFPGIFSREPERVSCAINGNFVAHVGEGAERFDPDSLPPYTGEEWNFR